MEEVNSIESLHTIYLQEPPCCLEVVPALPNHFVLGTYHLERREGRENDDDKKSDVAAEEVKGQKGNEQDETTTKATQNRSGRLHLFKVVDNRIHEVHQCRVDAAVLDVKFSQSHFKGKSDVFAVATSLGFIGLYAVDIAEGSPGGAPEDKSKNSGVIRHICNIQVLPRDELITSLAWDPVAPADHKDKVKLALTSTSGSVWELLLPIDLTTIRHDGSTRHSPTAADTESEKSLVQTHGAEAWVVAYGLSGPLPDARTILSGGDDACLMSSTASASQEFVSDWTNRKVHGAGITAIVPLRGELIATGSYDDHLRIIALPTVKGARPVLRHEINLGGGVWRIQPFDVEDQKPTYRAKLLVSCMYAGAFVVSIETTDGQDWQSDVLARFQEHQSMNYACGLVNAGDAVRQFLSCSFYDRRLCLWSCCCR